MLNVDDLESLEETKVILSDSVLMAEIRAAELEIRGGELFDSSKLSAHRGDYRVVYEIDDKSRVVTVVTVAHRSDVYRRR